MRINQNDHLLSRQNIALVCLIKTNSQHFDNSPIPVAVESQTWVCGRSLAEEIAGSNASGGGHGCPCILSAVCCQACATGRSLAQRSHIKCGVSECDLESSIMRMP